uniref:BLUF domain-containing protein n=1 Tax=Micrurus spixii TaxID=129469 RepID=A0A2D4MN07_9SAUR
MPRILPASQFIQWVIVPLLCHRLLPFRKWFCRSQVITMLRFNAGTLALGKHQKGTELWGKLDESPDEEERTSFLNHLLLDRVLHGAEDTKFLLHRLIFLAKISPDLADKRYLAEYWEQLFLNLQRQYCQGVGVTGLLLLYPTYIIHILESSSDVLHSVLRDLRDMEQQKRVLVLDAKILVMSHNLPARLFPQWSYKVLNLPERYLNYETSHEEPVEATISECLTALLKLGKHLLRYPKSPKNLPDHFLEKVPEFIVSQDTIGFLLECQELLSPAQFLHLFEFPLNIQMDSDSTHSLSDRLKLHLDWAALKEAFKKKCLHDV